MLTDEMRADGWIEHDGGRYEPGSAAASTWIAQAAPDRQDFWSGDNLSDRVHIIAYKMENSDA